jgi:hypothetical protein
MHAHLQAQQLLERHIPPGITLLTAGLGQLIKLCQLSISSSSSSSDKARWLVIDSSSCCCSMHAWTIGKRSCSSCLHIYLLLLLLLLLWQLLCQLLCKLVLLLLYRWLRS